MAVTIGKKEHLTREFILDRIGEYDIFKMYYPWQFELNRLCLSPFKNENTPSFVIGNKYEGHITFKGFNTPHKGDCFNFVMDMFNLSYDQALLKIAQDFSLLDGTNDYRRIIGSYVAPVARKKGTHIIATAKKWTEADIEYWKSYHLERKDLNFCDDTKIYSTDEWSINNQIQIMRRKELCFHYHLVNGRGSWIKVYRPHAPDKEKKWRSSIPFVEMHGLNNLKDCQIGFIQKSIKDGAFTAKYISGHVSIVQAEDISALTRENIDFINQNCEKVYVIFDNDDKGVRACTELTQETGWGYINPPKHLLDEGITDFADWARATNPQTVVEFFQSKGINI